MVTIYNAGSDSILNLINITKYFEYLYMNLNNRIGYLRGYSEYKENTFVEDTISPLGYLTVDTISRVKLSQYEKNQRKEVIEKYCNEKLLDRLSSIYSLLYRTTNVSSNQVMEFYLDLDNDMFLYVKEGMESRLQHLMSTNLRKKESVKKDCMRMLKHLEDEWAKLKQKTSHLENSVLVLHDEVSNVLMTVVDETSRVNEAVKRIEALNKLDKYIFKGIEMDDEFNLYMVLESNGEIYHSLPNFDSDIFGYSFNDTFDILKGVIYQVEKPIREYNNGKVIGELLKEQAKKGSLATIGTSHSLLNLMGYERELLKTEVSGGRILKYYRYTHPNKEYKAFTAIMEDDVIVSLL